MSKYFVVNPKLESQDKATLNEIRISKENISHGTFLKTREVSIDKLSEEDNLIHVEGRVVVKIDIDSKDSWTFESGQKIEYKRRFNNFNQREASPVNCHVISGDGMNKGAEILVHPNSIHESNRIYDYKDSNDTIRYYSILNEMCFAWHDGKEWRPIEPFQFGLRVFKQYEGVISNIDPEVVKNVLFVTSGEFKNKVVKTIVACDYEIVFQGRNGREQSLIRFRPSGDPKTKREEEAIAIHEDLTDKVLSGEYLVGYTISNAKTIQEINPHDRP